MSVRSTLARRNAGGPQYRVTPDRVIVEVHQFEALADSLSFTSNYGSIPSAVRQMGFDVKRLDNIGALQLEASRMEDVVQNIQSMDDMLSDGVISDVKSMVSSASSKEGRTLGGNIRSGILDFQSHEGPGKEAAIRSELISMGLENPITDAINELQGVLNAEVQFQPTTFGPRNLNLDVTSDKLDASSEDSDKPHVGDALEKMGVPDAWKEDTGSGAVAAIFDTAFSPEFLDVPRVIGEFSGEDAEGPYAKPEEGHGTMTAYSMAGNKEESGLEYHGAAKDADLLLARLSDASGGLKYTAEAWDWLVGKIRSLDKPIISNHSYGTPVCGGRGMDLCGTTTLRLVRALNQRDDHQAFYAAGNESLYCGHRLSGVTNGINGVNSIPESITCAAFRFDLRDAQNYSSHGYGTCNSLGQNPKPDLGCLLPSIVPYGNKEKDMSSGFGGSSGGTSEATPLTAGVTTLLASKLGTADSEVLEPILENTAAQVRPTQVNVVSGHDARFGHGQVRADRAMTSAINQIAEINPPEAEEGQSESSDSGSNNGDSDGGNGGDTEANAVFPLLR
jgi:hypothetical protein